MSGDTILDSMFEVLARCWTWGSWKFAAENPCFLANYRANPVFNNFESKIATQTSFEGDTWSMKEDNVAFRAGRKMKHPLAMDDSGSESDLSDEEDSGKVFLAPSNKAEAMKSREGRPCRTTRTYSRAKSLICKRSPDIEKYKLPPIRFFDKNCPPKARKSKVCNLSTKCT